MTHFNGDGMDILKDDRVAVIVEGKIVQARVAEPMAMGRFRLTFRKGDEGTVFLREQIFPLYRYVPVMTSGGPAMIPLPIKFAKTA